MAIQADTPNSVFGVPLTNVYYRIIHAVAAREEASPLGFSASIILSGYLADPRDKNIEPVERRQYRAPLAEIEIQSGDNFLARCYAWVMAQPDMAGSTAV